MKRYLVALLALALTLAFAQHTQPYKGEQARAVKALSAADMDGLLEGRGMGLAKAAELNNYPGPMHVLELKDELRLTATQEKQTRAAMDAMRGKAKRLGKQIIDAERKLDAEFADGKADVARVRRLTSQIGDLQAELRLAHLEAHLVMKRVLSAAQIRRYAELRGYGE